MTFFGMSSTGKSRYWRRKSDQFMTCFQRRCWIHGSLSSHNWQEGEYDGCIGDERRGWVCRAFRPCSSCGLRSDFGTGFARYGLRSDFRRGLPSTRRRRDGLGLSTGLRRRTGMHTEPNGYAYRIKVVCIQNWTSMHTGLQRHACRIGRVCMQISISVCRRIASPRETFGRITKRKCDSSVVRLVCLLI